MNKIRGFIITAFFAITLLSLLSCSYNGDGIIVDGQIGGAYTDGIPVAAVSTEVDACRVYYKYKSYKNIEISTDVDERYIFDGWYLVAGEKRMCISRDRSALIDVSRDAYKDYVVNGKLNIVACFDAALYVNYVLNGGSFGESEYIRSFDTREADAILPDFAVRNGHCFVGWRDEGGNLVERVPRGRTGEITLYAEWCEDYRDRLIGRVWTFSAPANIMLSDIGTVSDMVVEFVDESHVRVYTKMGERYFDMGRAYLSFIHSVTYFDKVKRDPENGNRYQYNDWDFGSLTEDSVSNLRYRIVNEKIMVYPTSDDEVYSAYVSDYFNWCVYMLQFDYKAERMEYLPIDYEATDAATGWFSAAFDAWVSLAGGNPQSPLSPVIPKTKNAIDCSEITHEWDSIYIPCDMDIGDLANTLSSYTMEGAQTLCLITDYNMLLMRWDAFTDSDMLQKYVWGYITSVRDSLLISTIAVKNADGYSLYMFSAITGYVIDLSQVGYNGILMELKVNNGAAELHMSVPAGDAGTEEMVFVLENTCSVTSDAAKEIYWVFSDRVPYESIT